MTTPTGGYQPPSTSGTFELADSTSDPTYPGETVYTTEAAPTTDLPSTTGATDVSRTDAGSPDTDTSTDSAKDTAKNEAATVGQSAKDAGGQVASTATDQAKNVAGETKRQAQDLIAQAHGQVKDQAGAQKEKATTGLRSLADELRSVADGNAPQNGMTSDLARQAADKAHEIASWIEARDAGTLLDEVRALARRKPGTFLLGAALAGVAAGRLTRGVVAANSSDDAASPSQVTTSSYDVGNSATYEATHPATAVTRADVRAADALVLEDNGAPLFESTGVGIGSDREGSRR